jgi:hypothetical protein
MLKVYGIVALVFLLSLGGAYQYGKSKATVVTQVQEVEKVVEKRDVITVVKEVTRPDGTKETITTKEDKSVINSKREKETTVAKNNWFISAGAGYNFDKTAAVYQVDINRRVLGDLFIGAYGTTNKELGIKVGIEF